MKTIIILTLTVAFSVNTLFSQFSHHDSIDVVHYDINLKVTDFNNHILFGHTQIEFKAKTATPVSTIAFDLYMYTIDSICLNGEQVTEYDYTDTVLSFASSNPVTNTQTETCDIYYSGEGNTEPGYGWGGIHAGNTMIYNMGVALDAVPHGFGRAWFPCIDNFDDRATYDIHLTTLENHRGIGTGILESVDNTDDNLKIWNWKLEKTSPTYLVSFVVGEFTKNEWIYNGIEEDIPVEIYALQSDSTAAANTFFDLNNILTVYEEKFGAYYWPKVGYSVVSFNSGAMEHITNIAYPSNALSTSLSNQTLVAHELSHHWFGNQVTCSTDGDMWLNEGWTSYCEAIYVEGIHGYNSFLNYVQSNHNSVVTSAHNADGAYWALSGIPNDLTYSTTVYDKGADVVHTLRNYMGDDNFFPAVQSYLTTFAENDASSEDLRDHLSSASGIDLTAFFDCWVFNGGFPVYIFDRMTENNGEYTIEISQRSVGRDFIADKNRVEITFVDENWNQYNEWMEFDGESGSYTFEPQFEPVMTVVDMNSKISDATINKYSVINSAQAWGPSGCGFTLLPIDLTDSVFIHVSKFWYGTNSGINNDPDLETIDAMQWRIQYDAKGSWSPNAKFDYNLGIYPEIEPEEDKTLVLIYRPNKDTEWTIVNQECYGNNTTGLIMAYSLQPGDYKLGWYDGEIGIDDRSVKSTFEVYPNPANDQIIVKTDDSFLNKEIVIYNQSGTCVKSFFAKDKTNYCNINVSDLPKGVYFVGIKNTKMQSKKIVIQ